jgi:hypothetical protein
MAPCDSASNIRRALGVGKLVNTTWMLLDTPLTEQKVLGLPRYSNVQYWQGLSDDAHHAIRRILNLLS